MIFSSPAILSLLLATSSVCSTSSFQIPVPCSSKTSARALEATNDVTETLDPFFSSSECDDSNTPPALGVTLRALDKLANGSDIRGKFVDHARIGSFAQISRAIQENSGAAALTPLAAHCLGYAFATMLKAAASDDNNIITICVGNDPREHGPRLADAFGRGAQGVQGVLVKYTGIASTPAMNDFCRAPLFCDGAVILTASHLPKDRNGLKFFTAAQGGFTRTDIQELVALAKEHVQTWQSMGIIPPTSGTGGVFCSEWVDFMPLYAENLSNALCREVGTTKDDAPLKGLKVVMNSGNGSGGFFHQVLHDLGADVSASMNVDYDSSFPSGVPNPEYQPLIDATTARCEESGADLGIMFDTDADRCGFIVPTREENVYEPLNRNRLIALLGVMFADTSPGCTIVTDSCTSEGLEQFLEQTLGLNHERYLKGYANVIGKARALTKSGAANAEVAIETSGHCAMKENDYLDDGTYTAVKILGLLAKVKKEGGNLLELIKDLQEMQETPELRLNVLDESLETTETIFTMAMIETERYCQDHEDWTVDANNLEGLRVRTDANGGFFMVRKSLHDPVISVQIEGESSEQIRAQVVSPLVQLLEEQENIKSAVDLTALKNY